MVENTIRKIKWFWPWQDENEEAWLRNMSKKGWHLFSLGLPCIYKFRAGEPRDYVYRLDYQTFRKKDKQEYQQLFHDAGWEHVGEVSASQYFRKEAQEGEAPEIFTDVESKIAKYKRVLAWFVFFTVGYGVIFFRSVWDGYPYSWWIIIRVVSLLVMVSLLYPTIRLILRIRKLRRL